VNRVFLDIDTQNDFLLPAGALYVPGAERIIPTLAKLNRFAMQNGDILISTACAHPEDDPEFRIYPPHCVVGTVGQLKPGELLVGQRVFEKQSTDLFESPEAEDLVSGVYEFIVYGVVTEICVKAAAFGLLARGRQVTLVEDATVALDPLLSRRFREEFEELGGEVTTSHGILESK
jgi:nicotinamidase/pyrazinamidase